MKIEWQRAAAYVIARDTQNRVLLTQFDIEGHPDSGAWTLPGGGMEWGEQAHETARREVREETGLEAEIGALLGVDSKWYTAEASALGQVGHAVRLVFAVRNLSGELKQDFDDDDTTAAAAWISVDEVQSLRRVPLVDFALELL